MPLDDEIELKEETDTCKQKTLKCMDYTIESKCSS